MQMRFDGTLGFAGGMIDEGESPEQCVTREFQEEIGCGEAGRSPVVFAEQVCIIKLFYTVKSCTPTLQCFFFL